MDYIDNVPPAIQLILSQDWGDISNSVEFSKRFRRVAKELATQAEWTVENFNYFDAKNLACDALILTTSGSLNPLDKPAGCGSLPCRIKSAAETARTLGVYADVFTIPDSLSFELMDLDNPDSEDIYLASEQIVILKILEPLIREGVVQFSPGIAPMCESCASHLYSEIDEAVEAIISSMPIEVEFDKKLNLLAVFPEGKEAKGWKFYSSIDKKMARKLKNGVSPLIVAKEPFRTTITSRVKSTFFDLAYSNQIGSTLFSNFRTELLALRGFDNDAPSLSNLAVWENARSIQLPWINELTMTQVLHLREMAKSALPGFRQTFFREICRPDQTPYSVADKISELRREAADVEAELRSLEIGKEAHFRNIAGALSITASVYGFAQGFMGADVAIGGLMAALGLIHGSHRHDKQNEDRLKSSPAYVLLSAKELSEHAR